MRNRLIVAVPRREHPHAQPSHRGRPSPGLVMGGSATPRADS